ncbi:hypothetical protein Ahy_A03g010537 isoform F [Arachis hypogaea]|uniref:Leucine-rich repeat-containing N-terminal plant-type domain-containing protein n=1 Tax=Arachis hypogaea TaxID=3818 RepID=A0A445DMK0_ARAHY|nr:hypothetical protein Ahy_A03g010537 isoform F [Arachis hypogaea]
MRMRFFWSCMERVTSWCFMGQFLICAILVLDVMLKVSANSEGDALNSLKNSLTDPGDVLQSWDSTLVNPCTWFHVTCSNDNSVIRVDLGNANLSGQLVPQLGQLPNLQYLELYSNNITGKIPIELGNLKNLVSLDLYVNKLTGPIPDSLSNLKKLRFLYDMLPFSRIFNLQNLLKSVSFCYFIYVLACILLTRNMFYDYLIFTRHCNNIKKKTIILPYQ